MRMSKTMAKKRYTNLTLKAEEAKWQVFEQCDRNFRKNDTCEGCQWNRGGACRQERLLEKIEEEITTTRRDAVKLMEELGFEPGTREYTAGMVLFGSGLLGVHTYRIAKWGGIPEEAILEIEPRLRENGIWKDSHVYAEWTDEENGTLAFILDVLVAVGDVRRSPVAPEKED